jgi:cation:H+ antiporter
MITQAAVLVVGAAALYLGAECLVRGAAGMARLFGVSPLIVGLTVVAYGTSMPEVVVSAVASFEGKGNLALANVIGSNIANLGLILGITSLFTPLRVDGSLVRRELPLLAATALVLPLLLVGGGVSRLEGVVLVAGAVAYTALAVGAKKKEREPLGPEHEPEPSGPRPAGKLRMALLAGVGLFLLVLGGRLLVDSAASMALALGISVRVVGLTVVAVGTSLPELATSLVAGIKGHSAIAVGNVVGSNIFNTLLVLGSASVVRPVTVSFASAVLDCSALWLLTAMGIMMLRGPRLTTRIEGALLLAVYGTFLVLLAVGWAR